MKPLIVITGPTASGKSALAIELAEKYNGEIICADSRTVYKGMDIGTAKPSAADQKRVKHHLLDVVVPGQPFTAAQFKKSANIAIDDITNRGKLPVMVGGTGLYIDAVIFDYQFGEPADPIRRAELQQMTLDELTQLCVDNDILLPTNSLNKRHLIRAVELGGLVQQEKKLRTDTLVVGITTYKEVLRQRVTERAKEMVRQGIVKEVEDMANRYGWENEAMTGNIYHILHPVVEGKMTLEEGIELFITSDMQLAKRQMTWLKRNPYIIWGSIDQLKPVVEHFVQQNKLLKSML